DRGGWVRRGAGGAGRAGGGDRGSLPAVYAAGCCGRGCLTRVWRCCCDAGPVDGWALPCGSSVKDWLWRGVNEALLEALIYMGAEEHGFPDKVELRPQVWRVFHVRDGNPGKVEMPAA